MNFQRAVQKASWAGRLHNRAGQWVAH